jgi:mannan endo-1,6-alpha-mannosidase
LTFRAFGPAIGAGVFGKDNLLPGGVSYYDLVDNTLTEIMEDWDYVACGGGVFWSRIKSETQGYKSAITNLQVMYLSSQLSLLDGSDSVELPEQVYDWLKSSGVITDDWMIYDGVNTEDECSINGLMTSYKAGLLFGSLGLMYKVSGRREYLNDANSILRKSFDRYLVKGIITDPCEEGDKCQKNQVSPKGIINAKV